MGENRYEFKPSGDNHGNVQSSQDKIPTAEWRGMKKHFGSHLAITYRDEINERIWMVGDFVILFEHFLSRSIFVGGLAGGEPCIAPWYIRQFQLTQSCMTNAAPGNGPIHGTGTRHHGHLGRVRHACCRVRRILHAATWGFKSRITVEDRDRN